MKHLANETHISLECAKLLKDCGLESEYHYEPTTNPYKEVWRIVFGKNNFPEEFLPAFTWQEILWKYHEEFFKKECLGWDTIKITIFLQEGKYEAAEKYFIKNCILIKNLTN